MAGVVEFDKHPSEDAEGRQGLQAGGRGSRLHARATPGDKADGEALLADLDGKLAELQEKLFAESSSAAPSGSC